jgi:hypothetical protein
MYAGVSKFDGETFLFLGIGRQNKWGYVSGGDNDASIIIM